MRLAKVMLVDATHRLPMADRGGRLFDAARGETVDVESPVWMSLIADGSVKVVDEASTAGASPVGVVAVSPTDLATADTPVLAAAVPAKGVRRG